jgi:hypothetical protein
MGLVRKSFPAWGWVDGTVQPRITTLLDIVLCCSFKQRVRKFLLSLIYAFLCACTQYVLNICIRRSNYEKKIRTLLALDRLSMCSSNHP